jgi:hypothetical protein
MAKKTIVQLIDDLDNSEVDDGQTIRFALQKDQYEIDLSGQNAQKLHEALAPFIAAGRRVDGRANGATTTVSGDSGQAQAIRQWAREHGMKVSERGRVSKEVQEAYRNAN